MLQKLLNQNPLLKVLAPILVGCLLIFLGVRIVSPQLSYREQLQSDVDLKQEELADLLKLAQSIAGKDEAKLEDKILALKADLGLGYYSPEIVHLLEDIAAETGIMIHNYQIEDLASQEELRSYQLSLGYSGKYSEILDFQQRLEELTFYTDTGELRLLGTDTPGVINGEAMFVITTFPKEYDKIEKSELPLKGNPFS